jgi:hypothetical protein
VSTNSNKLVGEALYATIASFMALAIVSVPCSNTPIKESAPLSTTFALLDGLFAEDVPVSLLATLSCTSVARGSFEVLAYCLVATLFPKMVARRP